MAGRLAHLDLKVKVSIVFFGISSDLARLEFELAVLFDSLPCRGVSLSSFLPS